MGAQVDWSRFSADPRRPEVAGVRASDADRETAIECLREAYADGRLDRIEFDRRSADALAATLLGEFAPLLQDLEPQLPQESSVHEQAVRRYRREARDARNGFVGISVLTTGIWGATNFGDILAGQAGFFWPVFPILGVGAGWLLQVLKRKDRIEHHERRIVRHRRETTED